MRCLPFAAAVTALGFLAAAANPGKRLALDRWTYIQVDDSRPRYGGKTSGGGGWFGLAAGDITGDGMLDIVSGQWFYRNPGGDMTGKWQRIPFGDLVDAVLITDVDGDEYADVIALKCNEQFWLEATDREGSAWSETKIGSLPVCNHGTGAQGYALAQLVAGGKPEIVLTAEGLFYLQIPADPQQGPWPFVAITDAGMNGEGVSAGDIDGDGDLDLATGANVDPADPNSDGRVVTWWENPGSLRGPWVRHNVGEANFWCDRFAVAEINGDGRPDIVVTEERYPGPDPDASLFWFEAPADPSSGTWKRHTVVTEYSLNNLDVADLDHDGDIDIVTCEHKGPKERLQIWENDGRGNFTVRQIDAGKESHLGARLADFDGDGDLDIFSIAWEDFQYLHLWRNDAK
jgi:FG-GAP-like repeat/FG-GAP repeat